MDFNLLRLPAHMYVPAGFGNREAPGMWAPLGPGLLSCVVSRRFGHASSQRVLGEEDAVQAGLAFDFYAVPHVGAHFFVVVGVVPPASSEAEQKDDDHTEAVDENDADDEKRCTGGVVGGLLSADARVGHVRQAGSSAGGRSATMQAFSARVVNNQS